MSELEDIREYVNDPTCGVFGRVMLDGKPIKSVKTEKDLEGREIIISTDLNHIRFMTDTLDVKFFYYVGSIDGSPIDLQLDLQARYGNKLNFPVLIQSINVDGVDWWWFKHAYRGKK